MEIVGQVSHLKSAPDGKLSVRIIQRKAGRDLLGRRTGFEGAQDTSRVTNREIQEFGERLKETQPGELAVLSYHPGVAGQRSNLSDLSHDRSIVTLGGIDSKKRNLTLIASNGEIVEQAKLSLSSEDLADDVVCGDKLYVFEPEGAAGCVRWAVLNCHDYSHPGILVELLKQQLDLLVVVTYNNATRLYWEYATSDVHRLFCYIVIVNVGELGGSGAFVPFRRVGRDENAKFGASGQIFGTRGPAEVDAVVTLDIGQLRERRDQFSREGLVRYRKDELAEEIDFMVPPQHYMDTFDECAGPPRVDGVDEIKIKWNSKNPTIAVGQLDSMPLEAYTDNRYRLRGASQVQCFEDRLLARLSFLEQESKLTQSPLDFLVLPEVLVPREFAERHLADFSRTNSAIVIAGVDYPGSSPSDNRNSCFVYFPDGTRHAYDKITRSQYDAIDADGRSLMPMNRGRRLLRFVNGDGRSFGVLICYDFSHLDLVHQINTADGREPLDILFVVAHNPYSTLYRSSCISDSHRFYQHVVMCNVASFGCSGVYAPQRVKGSRQTLMEVGHNTVAISTVRLDLDSVRDARGKPDKDLNDGVMMRKPGIYQWRQ